jgi:hypothetical protein
VDKQTGDKETRVIDVIGTSYCLTDSGGHEAFEVNAANGPAYFTKLLSSANK